MSGNRVIVVVVLLIAAMSLGGYQYWKGSSSSAIKFRTATVSKGDLTATIAATGTLEPEEVIDVGAQVAGQILSFGTDAQDKSIDYRSVVEEGMVLARIDDSLYQSDAAQQTAAVEQAKAGVIRAQADVTQMKAKADQAARDWDRAQKLGPSDALSQATYDGYKAAYDIANANVAVADAAVTQAKASLAAADASLARSRRNLGYCVIKSPVRGTIIDRRVNIGQTVVASLNAPSLFLIAKDLNRMQVWVAVNEADIGQIRPGQNVTFTVDAIPGRTFTGKVGKVRLNATMTQNVVTYTVEVVTENEDGKLLPYMTANAQFEVSHHTDVLLVPNAAIRYTPSQAAISLQEKDGDASSRPTSRPTGGKRDAKRNSSDELGGRGKLWVKDSTGLLTSISIRTGATDGSYTEISGKDVSEGMEIVVGEERPDNAANTTSVPFGPPQMPRGSGRAMR